MKKRKDGRYQKAVVIDGVKRVIYGRTQAEITQKIRDWKEKTENGATFAEVADEWWEIHSTTLANNTKPSYYAAQKRAVKNFGERYIKDILPCELFDYIADFSTAYSKQTVKNQIMIFNLIFRYAVSKGHTLHNVARELQAQKDLHKTKIEMPSDEEIDIIKKSYDKTFGDFIYWALYTGLRKGELLALTWEDVDPVNREIRVTKSIEFLGTTPHIKLPKTKKGIRTLPILDKLHEKIKYKKTGIIFHDGSGNHIRKDKYNRLWKQYQQETGTSFTTHQLRHAYSTMLYENKVPVKDAQYLLGHAQISTTMDIYAEIREKHKKKIHEEVYKIDI